MRIGIGIGNRGFWIKNKDLELGLGSGIWTRDWGLRWVNWINDWDWGLVLEILIGLGIEDWDGELALGIGDLGVGIRIGIGD